MGTSWTYCSTATHTNPNPSPPVWPEPTNGSHIQFRPWANRVGNASNIHPNSPTGSFLHTGHMGSMGEPILSCWCSDTNMFEYSIKKTKFGFGLTYIISFDSMLFTIHTQTSASLKSRLNYDMVFVSSRPDTHVTMLQPCSQLGNSFHPT